MFLRFCSRGGRSRVICKDCGTSFHRRGVPDGGTCRSRTHRTVHDSPGRSESLRLKSQRGGSSRKGGAIPILGDKRKGPGWAATPGSLARKYTTFHIDAGCSEWVSFTFWSSKHPPAPRKTTVDMTNYAFSRSHWMDHRLNHFVDGAKNRELPRRSANLMYSN